MPDTTNSPTTGVQPATQPATGVQPVSGVQPGVPFQDLTKWATKAPEGETLISTAYRDKVTDDLKFVENKPGAGGGILRVVSAAGFLLPDEGGQGGEEIGAPRPAARQQRRARGQRLDVQGEHAVQAVLVGDRRAFARVVQAATSANRRFTGLKAAMRKQAMGEGAA